MNFKRDSNLLYLPLNGNTYIVPWNNGNPIFDGFVNSQALINAWQAFVVSGDELEVIADPVPTPVIRSIDMRRLRLALREMQLLPTINTAIAALGEEAQIEWEYATDVKADHPLVVALATAMSLDVDAIFDLAETFT